jgi:alkylation response protein AidB-like acyl-CoA dehydrogenase
MADFGGDLSAFRTETAAWLKANYPPELRDPHSGRPEAMWGGRAFAGSDDPQIVWMKRMAARGWTTPTWPTQYGGGGLSPEQARILEQEMSRGGYRPAVVAFGIWMLGPVLMEFGNEAQKAEHLPKIVRGEVRWC